MKITTIYILHLFHCQSACAHKILLCHNLIIFKLLNLMFWWCKVTVIFFRFQEICLILLSLVATTAPIGDKSDKRLQNLSRDQQNRPYGVVAGTDLGMRLLWLRSPRLCHKIARFVHTLLFLCNLFRVELIIIKCFTLRQILFLCEYFPNANA